MTSARGVSATLRANVEDAWGSAGRAWLESLPDLLGSVTRAWQLDVEAPYELSFNWVAPVRRADGSAAVLKLGVPSSAHLSDEAEALRCFGGLGAVRLLERDADRGATLLEHAAPGTMLRDLVPAYDDEATAVVVDLMRRLHVPAPDDARLPEVSVHRESFVAHLRDVPCGTPPVPMVEQALTLFDELCASSTERVVVHGDLHHDNVLRAEREPWLAIDPHGAVGDPGIEIAPVLYNPDPWRRDDDLLALVPARLRRLADGLGMSYERAAAWGYVGCVLSEVWNAENGESSGGRALDVARLLARCRFALVR